MAGTITRRPLPALISLVALLLLTALVWWRVMNRDDATTAAAKPCPTPSASTSAAAPRTLPPPAAVDVLVLNATNRSGLAAKVRKTLMGDGFHSTLPADNDTAANRAKITGPVQIRYSAANKPAALLLQYYFPGAQLTQVSAASAQVTVSLGPKYTAVQAQRTVTSRLAASKITLTTTAPTPSARSSSSCSAG